jgi:hypothetical protein
MTDFSRDNQGYCRKHRCRVLLDEGCEQCWDETPKCCVCGELLPKHRDEDVEPYCEKCGPRHYNELREEEASDEPTI